MEQIEEWRSRLATQENSRKTQIAWCEENKISMHKFRYWKRKIDREEMKEIKFVEIPQDTDDEPMISIEAPGIKINIFKNIDREFLQELISAVRSC